MEYIIPSFVYVRREYIIRSFVYVRMEYIIRSFVYVRMEYIIRSFVYVRIEFIIRYFQKYIRIESDTYSIKKLITYSGLTRLLHFAL